MTEDTAFMQAILAAPGDDAVRLVYADWLEERGDIRGGYLRLATTLERLQEKQPSDDQRSRLRHARELGRLKARLRELQSQVPLDWLARLHRGRIEGCGIGFGTWTRYMCPGSWERLRETENPSVRRCDTCLRSVRLCRSVSEIGEAVRMMRPAVKLLAVERA